jgi:peptidoglycan/LPS O-acetylase OafA/YrhL
MSLDAQEAAKAEPGVFDEIATPPICIGSPKQRFSALDALRGFCAVTVVFYHMDALTHFYGWSVVRNAFHAVDFFFVLSGFVIASAYSDNLQTGEQLRRFAMRRFGRLYPLHAAVLSAYVLLQLWALAQHQDAFNDDFSVPGLIASIPLLQGFSSTPLTWNYPAWSISIELWFNLAFGLYVFWLGRRSVWVSAAIMLLAAAYVFLPPRQMPSLFRPDTAYTYVAQSVFGFLAGVFIYRAYLRIKQTWWRPGLASECLAVGLVVLEFGFGERFPAPYAPLLFCPVMLIFAFESGPISALLRNRACTGLGTISYSIYLTHSLYLLGMETLVQTLASRFAQPASVSVNGSDLLSLGGPWAMDIAGLVCVVATIAGSALTYRFIEEPARLRFNALSNGRRRAATAPRAEVMITTA